ncbi:MAG: hypothetical protein R3B72_38855 [Polyangiaceae bacterium]
MRALSPYRSPGASPSTKPRGTFFAAPSRDPLAPVVGEVVDGDHECEAPERDDRILRLALFGALAVLAVVGIVEASPIVVPMAVAVALIVLFAKIFDGVTARLLDRWDPPPADGAGPRR